MRSCRVFANVKFFNALRAILPASAPRQFEDGRIYGQNRLHWTRKAKDSGASPQGGFCAFALKGTKA
ncbi:MAG: hypothetical protein MPK62_07395 [Alphaproteobacteria bacterium]|nr:hypothetical protein [Alphaproteobacteria bacterium]MDA8030936.1 hypothetical protein [Alphaproteobacteria bacterium]